jgi:hypothetical protein
MAGMLFGGKFKYYFLSRAAPHFSKLVSIPAKGKSRRSKIQKPNWFLDIKTDRNWESYKAEFSTFLTSAKQEKSHFFGAY